MATIDFGGYTFEADDIEVTLPVATDAGRQPASLRPGAMHLNAPYLVCIGCVAWMNGDTKVILN